MPDDGPYLARSIRSEHCLPPSVSLRRSIFGRIKTSDACPSGHAVALAFRRCLVVAVSAWSQREPTQRQQGI